MEKKKAEELFQDIQNKMVVFRTTDDDKSKMVEVIRGMIDLLRESEGFNYVTSPVYNNWINEIEQELQDYTGIQRTMIKTKDRLDKDILER